MEGLEVRNDNDYNDIIVITRVYQHGADGGDRYTEIVATSEIITTRFNRIGINGDEE